MMNDVYLNCPLLLPQDKDGLAYDGFITVNVSKLRQSPTTEVA